MRKGELSRPKVSHKRAVELGAGMGLAGLAFALLGEAGCWHVAAAAAGSSAQRSDAGLARQTGPCATACQHRVRDSGGGNGSGGAPSPAAPALRACLQARTFC